jgi:gliding motility-associated-like protein
MPGFMQKLLIPILNIVLFCCSATILCAQDPVSIQIQEGKTTTNSQAEMCSDAGTFQFGPFIGQSNDSSPDTLYLCQNDSFFVNHNNNASFAGDPNPATPPGVVYGFYNCPPTIMGPNLGAVISDCFFFNTTTGLPNVAAGNINGDIWFRNTGALTTGFPAGVQYWFAPMTIDDFATRAYENTGPCVNVNTNDAFSVVYLRPIQIAGITTSLTPDGCVGKFRITGGLPAFDLTKSYQLDIFLSTDPSIKAQLKTNDLTNNTFIEFSVNVAGNYIINVEDGKSCGASSQFNMSVCDTVGAVRITAPNTVAETGSQICIPITVQNFILQDIATTAWSLNWNPAILAYKNFTTKLPGFDPLSINILQPGAAGFTYFDQTGNTINLANGDTLGIFCFTVLGPIGSRTDLTFSGNPTKASTTDINEEVLAIFNYGSVLVVNPGVATIGTKIITQGCSGGAQVEVQALGGPAPYTVTWTPGAGTANIAVLGGTTLTPNLPAGNYTFILTDNAGATSTASVQISAASLGATLANVSLPLCRDAKNGEIRAEITVNGTLVVNPGPQFTYQWSPSTVPNPTSNVQKGVGAGIYTVTITDTSNGCTAVAQGSLSHPSLLEVDGLPTITNASCTNAKDGRIDLLVKGGTPSPAGNYTFNWTSAPTVLGPFTIYQANQQSNPATLNALAASVYRVTVTDINGCSFTSQYTIGNIKSVSLALGSAINPTCFGGRGGAVTANIVTVPNTSGSYSFVWSPIPAGSTTNSSPISSTLSNVGAGNYILVATENITGCAARDTFTLTQPDSIKVNVARSNPTCANLSGGSIGLTLIGGVQPYNYIWSTPQGNNGQANNLTAGVYTVTITDGNMCPKVQSTTLTSPPAPSIALDSTKVACGLDGCVKAIGAPSGANTITQYRWSDRITGTLIGTTAEVCKLNGGDYIVTVTQSDGCTATDTISLFQPNILEVDTINYILPSCYAYPDGIIGVTMQGGKKPYKYAWSVPGVPSSPSLAPIEAGSYNVTVTDNNNCILVVNTILANPPRILVNYPSTTPASCYDACTGRAVAVVSYSPPRPANFNFVWSSAESDSLPKALCAGNNYVTISDVATNCFIVDSIVITQPAPILLDSTKIIPPTCAGDTNGSVELFAGGGNGAPYSYNWGFTTTNPAQPLAANTFTVTITDVNGCVDSVSVVVGEPNPVLVAIDFGITTDVICNGNQNGVAGVLVTGGNPGAFTYTWSSNVGTTPVVTDLAPGNYTVTVTDVFGCTGVSDTIFVKNPPPVQGSYAPWEPLLCAGDQTTFELDTIFGGAGAPYQFTVDFGVELPADFPVSITGGQHIISYLDRFGCSSEDTININEGISLQVNFGQPRVEIELGDTLYQLNPSITGGSIDDFVWTPINKLSDPTSLRPFANTFESTTYTLLVTDPNGCTGSASIFVKVDPNRNVYIPNAIAPSSGSGLNQRWKVFTRVGVDKVNYARVFDRWGELLYEVQDYKPNNDDYSEGWDGTYHGRKLNPGVYVYLVEVKFLDGRVLLYRGDISIIR